MATKYHSAKVIGLAAGAALAILVSACSTSGGTSQTTSSSQLIFSTAPATKDVAAVTWNLPYEPTSLDPIKTQLYVDAPVESNMCESLLKVQPDLSIAPNLALSYTQNADATVWTYKLRPGVQFWDGSTMTAADVVASLRRNIDPNSGSYWSLEYKNVKSIEATGSLQVTITMTHPDTLLNSTLASSGGAVSAAAELQKYGAKYGTPAAGVMCTGPYKFRSWKPGDAITLVKNGSYWNTQTPVRVSSLSFTFVSDTNTISSGLTSGSLDGMYQIPAAAIPKLKTASTGTLYQGPSTASLDLIPTERPGPMHDSHVRQALFLALDRNAVASGVYYGAATAAKSFLNPGVGYGSKVFQAYFNQLPTSKIDPAKAKQLLSQASGSTTGVIKLAASPDPSLITVANAVAAAGKYIGLNIQVATLTPAENDALYFDQKARDQYDAFLNVQWTPTTDPLEELDFVTKGAFTNYGLYASPTFEAAFSKALGIVNPDDRAAAVVTALKIVDAELPWVPIVNLPVTTFITNTLTGVPTSWAFLYGTWALGLGGK